MALKGHPDKAAIAPASRAPAWGVLAEEDEAAPVVRFATGDRSVSFPLHAFKRWEFQPGAPDTLTIRIEDETVTVQGHGLAVVRDALDAGALLILRAKPGRLPSAAPGETAVTGITFAVANP